MSSTFRSVFSHLIQNLDPDFQTLPPLGTAYIPDPAAVLPPPPSLRPAPSSAAPIPAASSSPVEFVPGKRGKPNALWDGQLLTFKIEPRPFLGLGEGLKIQNFIFIDIMLVGYRNYGFSYF